MTECRASVRLRVSRALRAPRSARALAALGLALAAATAPVAAQEAGEVPLLLEAPLRLVPVPPAGGAPEPPPAVSIGELEALGGDAAGVLGPAEGGFGRDLWRGTPGARAVALMRRLPLSARSPVMHGLARRLLASAAAPDGGWPDGWEEGAFATERVALLLRLGAFGEARRLVGAAGGALGAWPRVDMHFWLGEADRACALVRSSAARRAARRWRRALVLCQALDGDTHAAGLTLALLADRAEEAEVPYLRLAAHLLGQIAAAAPLFDDGLSLAASLASRVPVSAERVAGLTPGAARALAEHPGTAPATRLAAAERAAAAGALAPERLAEAWGLAAAATADGPAETPTGALARARLFAAAGAAGASARRADLLTALWMSASDGPGGGPGPVALARATAASALELAPGPALAWFAPHAARALIAAGRGPEAAKWWRVANGSAADPAPDSAPDSATGDAAAGDAAEIAAARWRVLPLAAAFGAGAEWDAAAAVRWWRAAPAGMAPDALAARADRVFMVLDALGRPPGADAWALFHDGPRATEVTLPNIGVRYGMRDAARAGRAGEALLLALAALGEEGPASASSVAVGSVIRVLRALGLADDARAVAVEALLGGAA